MGCAYKYIYNSNLHHLAPNVMIEASSYICKLKFSALSELTSYISQICNTLKNARVEAGLIQSHLTQQLQS